MTSLAATTTADAELDDTFGPIFERIASGAVEREIDRRLAHEAIGWLRAARFGALRVPVEFGGYGVSVRQLFRLLIDLAAAESNLPQALRVHFSFVEDQVLAEPGPAREHWLRELSAGTLIGNAITEPGVGAVDRYRTALTRAGDRQVLNGVKFYSTGSPPPTSNWCSSRSSRASRNAPNPTSAAGYRPAPAATPTPPPTSPAGTHWYSR